MNDAVTERATSAPARDYGELLMRMLSDPNIPADKMDIVIRARREVIEDEAREAYQFHFAQFASELPPVERDGTVDLGGGKGKYPFTTYEQMDSVLRPLLTKYGLSLQFWSSAPESKEIVVVHGALIGWGWQREATYPVPPDTGPGRNALQARGSAQTYAKRYIADLLCNVVRKGKDDDGRTTLRDLIDAAQLAMLEDLIKKTKTDAKTFLATMVTDIEELGDIRQRDLPRLELALREKLKRMVRTEEKK
jgi:hypothetical protein